jgi:hypothetical protein
VLISRGCSIESIGEELNEKGRSESGNDCMNQVEKKKQYQLDLNKILMANITEQLL